MRKIKDKEKRALAFIGASNRGFEEFKRKMMEQHMSTDYNHIKQELNKQIETIKRTNSRIVCNMRLQSIQQDLDKYITDHDVIVYSLDKWIKDLRSIYPKGSLKSQVYESFLSPIQSSIQLTGIVFDILNDMGYTFPKNLSVDNFIDYLKAFTDHLKTDLTSLLAIQDEVLIHWYISTMCYVNDVDVSIKQWVEDNKNSMDAFEQLPSAIWMNILADKIILNPRNLKQLMKLHSMISVLYYFYSKDQFKEEENTVQESSFL